MLMLLPGVELGREAWTGTAPRRAVGRVVLQVRWGLVSRPRRVPRLLVVLWSVNWTRCCRFCERGGQVREVERLRWMMLKLAGRRRWLSEAWPEWLLRG